MEAINCPFTEILDGRKQFIVPVFQRDYRWTSEQCHQMWNDILRIGHGDEGHFIGSIVYVRGGPDNVAFQQWLVIDGQQRLASLTLLMAALRDHIYETRWSGTEDSPTVDQINAYFLKNMYETGDRHYKLVLRRADDATLRALVDRSRPPGGEGTSDLIIEAYEHFRSCLCDPGCDLDVVYHGVNRLNIVNITLQRGTDNPQLIFESLNSTGVDLSQSDLVRNYLLMGLNEEEQTRLYDGYWCEIEVCFKDSGDSFESFLRDYVAHRMKSVQQPRFNRIYEEFKSFRQQKCEESLETLLSEMVPIARFYASFRGLASVSELPEELSDAMGNMRKLATTQGPLVMQLYNLYKNDSLSQEDFARAITLIESYILRRSVVGLSSRSYWEIFARIARDMGSELESLRVALARLRDNNRFPDDDEFKEALEKCNLYDHLWICRHILDRIENAEQKERSPVDNYSIEHIMPQDILGVSEWQEMLGDDWETIHRTWLHRLGNLTLTAYNSTYSNRPFHKKRDIKGGFRDSAVRLNRSVRDQDKWTETQIRERGEQLVRCALDIWPHHGADQKLLRKAELLELQNRADEKTSNSLEMNSNVRGVLGTIQRSIHELGNVIETVERESVCCYYGPRLFAELLPISYYVRVMLPLDFSDIERPDGIKVSDDSSLKFVPRRVHPNCRLLVDIYEESQVVAAMPIIHQAFDRQVL